MNEPELIWRFGRWIGAHRAGSARLTWSDGEIVLQTRNGKVVGMAGPDPSLIASELACSPTGFADLLLEARAIAQRTANPEARALAVVKSILEASLRAWILDENRKLELADSEIEAEEGPTISLPHAVVEMFLGDDEADLGSAVLPDPQVLLRRGPGFLEAYAALQLTEEADLIAAKITGQRTAEEIAARSPHGSREVLRLLGALVVAGLLEPVAVAEVEQAMPVDLAALAPEPNRRRLSFGWIVGIVLLVVAILTVLGWTVIHNRNARSESSVRWGFVVDSGCEPQDLQRILKKAGKYPKELVAQRKDQEAGGEPCWELVWGHFASRDAAAAALSSIPQGMTSKGFSSTVVELSADSAPAGDRGN